MALHSLHQTLVARMIRPLILSSGLRLRSPAKVCVAFMTSKEFRDPDIKKPKPWPYETKKFNIFHTLYDRATDRFDENTKVIVVDGNIAVGKTTFAQKLAEEFDLKYIPEPTMDRYYITPYGYDLREIDDLMPRSFKACDLKTFYSNPHHYNVAKFQMHMFMARFEDYADALAHVLNTGQGVVMDRSVFSDFVFMEAMHKAGYVRLAARNLHRDVYNKVIRHLMRPHLLVYLDVPVEIVLERIKARNNPIEVNSKVLTKDYLQTLEDVYKNEYLKRFSEHSEVLIYDWSHYGDIEVVVEDIERVNLDDYTRRDVKMSDWRLEDHWEWSYFRRLYTSRKQRLALTARLFRPEVEELHHPHGEYLKYRAILDKVPGQKYQTGYNPEMGDKYLFKVKYEGKDGFL